MLATHLNARIKQLRNVLVFVRFPGNPRYQVVSYCMHYTHDSDVPRLVSNPKDDYGGDLVNPRIVRVSTHIWNLSPMEKRCYMAELFDRVVDAQSDETALKRVLDSYGDSQ